MTDQQRLAAGCSIPFVTMLIVWCMVVVAGARPRDLSHAATIYGGIFMSFGAGLLNLLPFWLYNVFLASRTRLLTGQVQSSRGTNAGLVVGTVLFYSINALCHGLIWWDHFSMPRIDAQEGLAYLLVWLFSVAALYIGYGVGALFGRAKVLFKT